MADYAPTPEDLAAFAPLFTMFMEKMGAMPAEW